MFLTQVFPFRYGHFETALDLKISEAGSVHSADDALVLEPSAASRLLQLLVALPHGALKKSHALANLVETSNNVASVHPTAGEGGGASSSSPATIGYSIVTSTRSSFGPALEAVRTVHWMSFVTPRIRLEVLEHHGPNHVTGPPHFCMQHSVINPSFQPPPSYY